jgi:hypothetical protein
MSRKTLTLIKLLVISFFLIVGIILWARRNEPKTLVYPASSVIRAPLPLTDTTRHDMK